MSFNGHALLTVQQIRSMNERIDLSTVITVAQQLWVSWVSRLADTPQFRTRLFVRHLTILRLVWLLSCRIGIFSLRLFYRLFDIRDVGIRFVSCFWTLHFRRSVISSIFVCRCLIRGVFFTSDCTWTLRRPSCALPRPTAGFKWWASQLRGKEGGRGRKGGWTWLRPCLIDCMASGRIRVGRTTDADMLLISRSTHWLAADMSCDIYCCVAKLFCWLFSAIICTAVFVKFMVRSLDSAQRTMWKSLYANSTAANSWTTKALFIYY